MIANLFLLTIFSFHSHSLPLLIPQDSVKYPGTIILRIAGLNNDNGDVKVGLFNSAQSFSGKTKEKFGGTIVKIFDKKAQCVFSNIPYGEYAIKLFHDEDADDKIQTNFLGMPTEQYGFSNNAKGFFGIPSFDKAKFTVSSDTVRVEINLD
jgi:uncharacterized protein (DUF2141 family)